MTTPAKEIAATPSSEDWPDEVGPSSFFSFEPCVDEESTFLGEERARQTQGRDFHFSAAKARFAGKVLVGIALVFVFTSACYISLVTRDLPDAGAIFGDLLKTVIPSIATLVLGMVIHDRRA